ncbi:MAG: D-alanyl-D-alanine carboxypeptidase family protein [Bacilli bacterium]|nr:D-alanyl-D-alanine carboxypeptidase family protein [Bacilli bacterium]
MGLLVYFFAFKKDAKIEIRENVTINQNKKITIKDLVRSIENATIVNGNEEVDTSKIGNINVKIIIKDNYNKDKEYNTKVIVVDGDVPVINFKNKLTTELGVKIDLLDGVSAKDGDDDVKVSVEGEYDFNKSGEYKLYYIAKDDDGNVTKEEFTLIVGEKKQEQKNNSTGVVEHTKEDGEFTTSKGFKGYTKNGITYIDGFLVVNKTYALPSTYAPGLNSDVESKAKVMFDAANKEEGFNIYIVSGFRSYDTQKRLYNNYAARDGASSADVYSARPGHSEHQSGLAFDVCHNGYGCINSTFDNTPPAKWLAKNAYKYGFILRFPKNKTNETGYQYESWHFRYVGVELATKLYNDGNWISLEDYFGITSEYDY